MTTQMSDNHLSRLHWGIDMADDLPIEPSIKVRIVYLDLPDLVEVETSVVSGDW